MYAPYIRRLGATLRATVALGASSEAFAMFNFYNVKTSSNSSPYGWTGRTAPLSTSVLVSNIFLPAYVCSSGSSTVDSSGNLTASGCDASNGTLNPSNPFASSGQLANLYGTPNVPRSSKTDAKTYRVSAGVRGSFGDSGFDYSIGATYSKVDLNIEQNGYIFLQGLMDAVAQGTYNFADPASNSQAAIDQVFPTNYKTAKSSLAQVQATLAKDLFALPGGNVNLAIAGQFRHETLDNPSANPDNANPNARYFSINPVGVTGKRDIWSAAYELTVPLLEELRLKADGSYDHYSTGQSAFSPKFEAEFTPVNWLKVRGTFSKGFRAPNFNESFQLPATGYSNANIDCTNATYAAFCAAHASNPAYYQGGYSVGLTSSGNPNLDPEKSTSYTFGVVLQPTRRITITADFWHTKISNLIVPASASSDIYNQYYTNNGVVNVPGITVLPGQPDTDNPNALPLLGFIQASFKNANALKGEGLDFTVDTVVPLNENISWHSKGSASYLLRLEQLNDLPDGSIEVWRYDGTLGQCGLTSCSGAPSFRATWQNTLNFKDTTSVTLTANYTSRYSMVATDSGGVYGDCEASGSAGQLLTYDNGDPVLCYSKPVFYLDGHVETKVADKFTVYMDVLNLLDNKAKFDPNAAYGIYGFNPAWSDRLFVGRYFRVGVKLDF